MPEDIIKQLTEIATKQEAMEGVLKNQGKTIEKYAESLVNINETLLRNTITVEEHHRRSLQLEKELDSIKENFRGDMQALEQEIEPIKAHVQQVSGVGKFIRWISFAAGAGLSIMGLLELFKIFFN